MATTISFIAFVVAFSMPGEAAEQQCSRGFRWNGSECERIEVPANASISVLGDDWACNRGFKRSGDSCVEMTAAENLEQEKLLQRLLSRRAGFQSGDRLHTTTYRIVGTFDGCEYGKLYELSAGGILECQQFRYFYAYSPMVRANGHRVVAIDNHDVNGYIHDGRVIRTNVSGEFEGCDYDKSYNFSNGYIFGSSAESVGAFWLRQVTQRVVQGDFETSIGPKAIGLFGGEFGLVVQSFDRAR